MITYKGFEKGLICRGHRFRAHEVNVCEKAKTAREGFHSAENPLDVLTYYPNPETSEYWMCEASGDVDEDGRDSKVASTHIIPLRKIGLYELLRSGGIRHLERDDFATDNMHRFCETAEARRGYAIAAGECPRAKGTKSGDFLLILSPETAAIYRVGTDGIKPNVWYNASGKEVTP